MNKERQGRKNEEIKIHWRVSRQRSMRHGGSVQVMESHCEAALGSKETGAIDDRRVIEQRQSCGSSS